MEKCRYCLGEKFVKNGFVRLVQLHRCNYCGKNQIIGGKRGKYDNKTRGQALAMYLIPIHYQSIRDEIPRPPLGGKRAFTKRACIPSHHHSILDRS